MKVVAITDIHGTYHTAEAIIEHEKPDLIVLGGDLTNLGSVRHVQETLDRFRRHQENMFAIAGNMDLPQHDDYYARLGISLNGVGVIKDGIGWFGVSAAPVSKLRTPYEISEEEIAEKILAGYNMVRGAERTILVAHPPPYGTRIDIVHGGYHVGSTAVRDFIEDHQPDLVLSGHIHEGRGRDRIEKTVVVNCGYGKNGYYVVLDIDKEIAVYEKYFPL